jgi:hypothetical protein
MSKKKGAPSATRVKPEKNWKLMYLRAEKLIRARKLGMDYPVKTVRQILDVEQPPEEK